MIFETYEIAQHISLSILVQICQIENRRAHKGDGTIHIIYLIQSIVGYASQSQSTDILTGSRIVEGTGKTQNEFLWEVVSAGKTLWGPSHFYN